MKIRQLRKELKLTQMDVASAVGVSLNAFILWERGINKPTLENQKKLQEVLKNDELFRE